MVHLVHPVAPQGQPQSDVGHVLGLQRAVRQVQVRRVAGGITQHVTLVGRHGGRHEEHGEGAHEGQHGEHSRMLPRSTPPPTPTADLLPTSTLQAERYPNASPHLLQAQARASQAGLRTD